MSRQQDLSSQTNVDHSLKGTHLTFLTPGRKVPHLKTTLTKPQNVFLENLSPLYRRTVSQPVHHISEVYTSPVLSTGTKTELTEKTNSIENENEHVEIGTSDTEEHERKRQWDNHYEDEFSKTDAAVTEAHIKDINNSVEIGSTNPAKDLKRKVTSGTCGQDRLSKIDIAGMEAQIISKNLFSVKDVEKPPGFNTLSDFKSQSSPFDSGNQGNETINEESQRPCNYDNGNQNKGTVQEGRRRYTPSFCSSCSCDDSLIAQSRCSVCDGCSFSTCNSSFSHLDPSRVGPSGDCGDSFVHPFEMSATKIDNLLDSHLSFDDLDASLLKPDEEDVHRLKAKDNPNKLSLSTEQLIFLLLRLVLSKYKHLTEDLSLEKQKSRSQRQSIAYLIQAVLLLSRRVKNTSEQWHKTQTQLKLIQTEHERLRKQQRKIHIVLCILLVLNICRIQAVKQRIMRIVKFFGFVENVKKINRLRKMVAENWRNIPSLLTDFWRIFIFRSTTRLKNS